MAEVRPFRESPGWAVRAREAAIDGLDAFDSEDSESEPSPPAITTAPERSAPATATSLEPAVPAIRTSPERPPVSLAALRAAGIQLSGEEGVAIGQSLCRAIMAVQLLRRIRPDTDTSSGSSPVTADTVLLDATGRVGLANDPPDVATAIQSVGRVLFDILPVNIRLILDTKIMSKALASPPEFETVDELSQALAQYEEHNATELIQAVYERWDKLEVKPLALVTPGAPETALMLALPEPKPPTRMRSGYHPMTVAAAVAVTIAISATSAWFLMPALDAENSTVVVGVAPVLQATAILPPLGANFPELMAAVIPQRTGLAEGANAAVTSLAVADQRAPSARPLPIARPERLSGFAARPSVVRDERPLISAPISTRPVTAAAAELTRSNDGAAKEIGSPAEPVEKAPARPESVSNRWPARPETPRPTYSLKDAHVTPPVPVHPRLLAGLQPSSPGVRLDALNIAVVVNEDGTPYSVMAVNAPENMGEYVLLTAALAAVKSWDFSPAMKDGTPVRYRLIVPLRAMTGPAP